MLITVNKRTSLGQMYMIHQSDTTLLILLTTFFLVKGSSISP